MIITDNTDITLLNYKDMLKENENNICPKSFKLSVSDIRTICECLLDFKININDMDHGDVYNNMRKELKIKQVDKLFYMFESYANYKGGTLETALDKCIASNKNKKSDIGEDAITLMANGYKK